MTSSLIYLDNSTATRPSEKAVSEMIPFWTTYWGHFSSAHQKGQELNSFVKKYYTSLYQSIGADEKDHIILTSSNSEAVNHVVCSTYRDVTLSTGKNQFLCSNLEEASTLFSISELEPFGCLGKHVEVNHEGIITVDALAARLSPRTALLSLSWGNGLTGSIQPLGEIAKLCKERGVRLHVNASHVIGKLYFDLKTSGIDFLTMSGDQIHAPKGTGLLYCREGIKLSPFILGGSDQGGLRAGALPLASLAGFTKALEEAIENRDLICTETARLRNRFEGAILKRIPEAKVFLKGKERLPHCTTLLFPGLCNEALLFYLNRKGVCATIGGGAFQQLALQLISQGVDESLAHSAVSFSLSKNTSEEEIERAIPLVVEAVIALTKISQRIRG